MLLLIPLMMINGTVKERTHYRDQAVARVSQSTAGAQQLLGPLRVMPYQQTRLVRDKDDAGQPREREEIEHGYLFQTPKNMQVDGKLTPSTRRVGLFDVPIYQWQARLAADYAPLALPAVSGRTYARPYLVVGLSDVRGLLGTPVLRSGEQLLELQAGSADMSGYMKGVHALLPAVDGNNAVTTALPAVAVTMDFSLAGTQSLSVATIADNNQVSMNSSWPHPSFSGRFLPNQRETGEAGFKADWQVSSLASDAQTQLQELGSPDQVDSVQVSLVDPVDIYTMADRASKYGILFVVLTFVGFALFELLKRLPIHPLQYLLVGLALAIFFLLLLSLSEHMPFLAAYLTAAAACIGLQFVYLSGVLRSGWRAAGFAGMLTLLYGMLYGLLISEDNALLMGSLMLFGILAGIMWITRKVNWYELGSQLR